MANTELLLLSTARWVETAQTSQLHHVETKTKPKNPCRTPGQTILNLSEWRQRREQSGDRGAVETERRRRDQWSGAEWIYRGTLRQHFSSNKEHVLPLPLTAGLERQALLAHIWLSDCCSHRGRERERVCVCVCVCEKWVVSIHTILNPHCIRPFIQRGEGRETSWWRGRKSPEDRCARGNKRSLLFQLIVWHC